MSNDLIRNGITITIAVIGGFFALTNREAIYELIGFHPRDIANARAERQINEARETIASAPSLGRLSTIYKSADGHYWADAQVNNARIEFLVDTGASMVALTPDDARTIGLNPDNLTYNRRVNTAAGQIMTAPVELAHISVGNVKVYNVSAVVIPNGLSHSLLGMAYLGQIRKVEVTPTEMVLRQ